MERLIEALARAKQDAAAAQAQARDAADDHAEVEAGGTLAEAKPEDNVPAEDIVPGIGSATERIAALAAASVAGPHRSAAASLGDIVVPITAARTGYDPVMQPINPRAVRSLEDVEAQAGEVDADEGVFAEPLPRVAPPPADRGDARQIVYTRTRKHAVSAEFLRAHRVIAGFERHGAVDAYKILCTQVLQRMRDNNWNALAVVSPGFHEGKTLTAVNLAVGLAREAGHTVLLVDADLRHPSVHEYLDMPAEPGLSEHLLDGTPLEEILVNPGIDKFVVLPGGRALNSSSELLGSQKMFTLVTELKRRYPSRIVIFDLPPVLTSADALAFGPHVDATIMVVEEGKTGSEDVLRAAELLESANLIGTVLNNSRAFGVVGEKRAARKGLRNAARNEPRLNRVPEDDGRGEARAAEEAQAPAGRPRLWQRLFARRR